MDSVLETLNCSCCLLKPADWISLASLVLAIIGGLAAFYQWRRSVTINRANFINEISGKLRTDENIRKVLYIIDYGNSWYGKDFHGSNFEPEVDRMLSYFSYICYLRETNLVGKKEFEFFTYSLHRILCNRDVVNYLFNIYHFAQKNNSETSFCYLFKYAREHHSFDVDFYNRRSKKFPHILNIDE